MIIEDNWNNIDILKEFGLSEKGTMLNILEGKYKVYKQNNILMGVQLFNI